MQHLAPIALFVYNRPDHTWRTLKHLRENLLASESRLFIFSDAPKTAADEDKVREVRALAQDFIGFKSVKIISRPQHMGLANSIISGITQLTDEYGKIIVLEDDLLTSPFALTYFNEALDRYQAEDRVMQIAGYMFPIKGADTLPETFFIRTISSWGWATWGRAWKHFEPDVKKLHQQFTEENIQSFTFDGTMNYWKQLLHNLKQKNDSWAIRWHAAVFLNNGLVLQPAKSLIENIGHDGSGVHSIIEDTYKVSLSEKPVSQFPSHIEENQQAVTLIKEFYRHRKGSVVKRGKKFLINQWYKWKNKIK